MNAMELAKRVVDYVDRVSRDYNAERFGVPLARGTRKEIDQGVAKLLSESPPPTPTFDTARCAGVMLVAAGVLTQQQWDAAVAFVAAIGEGAK